MPRWRSLAALGAMLTSVVPASAQQGATITIGRIESTKACKIYQESAGRSGLVATPYMIGAYSSWRTWLVKDCVDNFAGMRSALQAALGAAAGVALRGRSGRFTVEGRLSDVSGGPGEGAPSARPPGEGGYSVATTGMRIVADIVVRDGTGRIVFGVPLVKTIEIGSDIRVEGFRASSSEAGEALYGRLQQEVALAVARSVAFHLTPLRIETVDGPTVQLNYGAPLLKLGTTVQAIAPGGKVLRFNVVASDERGAVARLDNGGDLSTLTPGTPASVIEADDPAANARRFEKVDLP